MSYTPPAGNAANYSFAGEPTYTPPAGNAADYSFYEATVVVSLLNYWNGASWSTQAY